MWTTKVKLTYNQGLIQDHSSVLSIGSCFADHIGQKLVQSGMDVVVNPFGVLFNPFSILNALISAKNDMIDDQLFLERNGLHLHYNYHSDLNDGSSAALRQKIRVANEQVKQKLIAGDILQLTFGTAWVYQLKDSDKIVANCHKMPQEKFSKALLNIDILKTVYTTFFAELLQQNPKIRVILTVSPVRHTKDGLHENSISKSILHLLCDHLQQQFKQAVFYFPAYEIVIDELRDYRFYKADMVHPNDQAIDYVFDKYLEAYGDDRLKTIVDLADKIRRAEAHQFMHASAEEKAKHNEYIAGLKSQLNQIKASR